MNEFPLSFIADRSGDTFRWRGENVSTTQVEATLGQLIGDNRSVAVYGVQIPGAEGRAGMAAIPGRVDLERLAEVMNEHLPKYAQPVFIRFVKRLDLTATYKLRKGDLKKEAFNVTKISDPIFYRGADEKNYRRLDVKTYEKLMQGKSFAKL